VSESEKYSGWPYHGVLVGHRQCLQFDNRKHLMTVQTVCCQARVDVRISWIASEGQKREEFLISERLLMAPADVASSLRCIIEQSA
jgi:hypothetical protein